MPYNFRYHSGAIRNWTPTNAFVLMTGKQPNFLQDVLTSTPGYEEEVFNRYADRLIAFASSRLPANVNARVDSEDIIQSVFRSFFRRHAKGEFDFDGTIDLWRLLAAMTYRKVIRTIKHHGRHRRNVQLDQPSDVGEPVNIADLSPGPEQVNILMDYLRWIFDRLPETSQAVVKLRLDGNSIAEISESVKVSQRTVKRILAHVRELISKKLSEEQEE